MPKIYKYKKWFYPHWWVEQGNEVIPFNSVISDLKDLPNKKYSKEFTIDKVYNSYTKKTKIYIFRFFEYDLYEEAFNKRAKIFAKRYAKLINKVADADNITN